MVSVSVLGQYQHIFEVSIGQVHHTSTNSVVCAYFLVFIKLKMMIKLIITAHSTLFFHSVISIGACSCEYL